jgi:hypothetical protein
MRSLRTIFAAVIACACFVVTPALAGQHGHAPTPPAATHSTSATPATSTPSANTAARPAPLSVPQKITGNPALVARLTPLLPTGLTLTNAANGFKNQGQFIAALHVSKNLNIPFASLKTEMTGTDHDSLGQAIQELRPTASVKTAVKTAEQQARADIKATRPATSDTDKDDR